MDKLKTDRDIMVYLRNIRDNLEKIAEKTGPVSYTHLDVYKRQPFFCTRRCNACKYIIDRRN